MVHLAPDHDAERVYVSDIKKLVNWYLALYQLAPALLEKPKEGKKESKSAAKAEEKSTAEAIDKNEAQPDPPKKAPATKKDA